MITLTTLAAVATAAGLVNGFLPLLQISKVVRERSAGGFSIAYLAGGLANSVIWNAYAFALGNWALILPGALGFVMSVALLAVALRFRPRRPRLELVPELDDTLVHVPRLAA